MPRAARQSQAAVGQLDVRPRIVEETAVVGREGLRRRDHGGGDLEDPDLLQTGQIQQGAGGHARAQADHRRRAHPPVEQGGDVPEESLQAQVDRCARGDHLPVHAQGADRTPVRLAAVLDGDRGARSVVQGDDVHSLARLRRLAHAEGGEGRGQSDGGDQASHWPPGDDGGGGEGDGREDQERAARADEAGEDQPRQEAAAQGAGGVHGVDPTQDRFGRAGGVAGQQGRRGRGQGHAQGQGRPEQGQRRQEGVGQPQADDAGPGRHAIGERAEEVRLPQLPGEQGQADQGRGAEGGGGVEEGLGRGSRAPSGPGQVAAAQADAEEEHGQDDGVGVDRGSGDRDQDAGQQHLQAQAGQAQQEGGRQPPIAPGRRGGGRVPCRVRRVGGARRGRPGSPQQAGREGGREDVETGGRHQGAGEAQQRHGHQRPQERSGSGAEGVRAVEGRRLPACRGADADGQSPHDGEGGAHGDRRGEQQPRREECAGRRRAGRLYRFESEG
ncbi:MAG: hypothetical protein QF410_04445 [Planctomycetota bacterium]|nr:hypothetical protein [Planctomycetota bacterium]